jgi:hypothetical protein
MKESSLVPFELLGETLELPTGPVTFRSRLDALLAAGFFIEPDKPATDHTQPGRDKPRLTVSEILGGPELLI